MLRRALCGGVALAVLAGSALGEARQPHRSARATALRAVCAFLLEPNAEDMRELAAKNAEWKNRGPGSAEQLIQGVTKELEKLREARGGRVGDPVAVQEIIFFTHEGLAAVKTRFPAAGGMWQDDRVPARMKDALGCFVRSAFKARGREETVFHVFLLKKVGDTHKVVYFDDK